MSHNSSIANTTLTELAEAYATEVGKGLRSHDRKSKGQFFTPGAVARLMSELCRLNRRSIRVLDPGSGLGILVCALCDRLLREQKKVNLSVDLYEPEGNFRAPLTNVMEECSKRLANRDIGFSYRIIQDDFILSNRLLFEENRSPEVSYDLAISNPPYFKVRRDSVYSRVLQDYVFGQPNIYFMFMIVAANLIRSGGQLVFITPRSYCSGAYFERFRQSFFEEIYPEHIHIFDSRRDNFEDVLQENIILSGSRSFARSNKITISVSNSGSDKPSSVLEVDRQLILDNIYGEMIVRIPTSPTDVAILRMFDKWSNSLAVMNMEISTGPVVTFRHKKEIMPYNPNTCYPLLFMHHLRDGMVRFPSGYKDYGINRQTKRKSILIPSSNYVILKRFTSKEQIKRLQVATYFNDESPADSIGLENHLNYIYSNDGSLSREEVVGLAAFLDSDFVDRYFRIVNGNTQVNASDIRSLPFPEHEFLRSLGAGLLNGSLSRIDVAKMIGGYLQMSNKIDEAIDVLTSLGLPRRQQNERSALVLLALLNVGKEETWDQATEGRLLRIHDMIKWMEASYGKKYQENTRESIRRQTLHQFEQAALVVKNPDDPTRPTNSGNTCYGVTPEALELLRLYGSERWIKALEAYLEKHPSLQDKYARRRKVNRIRVTMRNGEEIELSPGVHNELQRNIINEFAEIFLDDAQVLYVGDTARKNLYIDEDLFNELGIPIPSHDKLPDVLMYDPENKWLILVEAVTSHGPVSSKRLEELERLFSDCIAERIYVSAFPDWATFKKYVDDIAWDTDVWIAEVPDHMLHFNGAQFLQPRT
jgi:adenine-specific DNA-methyltransferase